MKNKQKMNDWINQQNLEPDYTTNSKDYYHALARKTKLIKLLALKIWDYEELLDITLEDLEKRLKWYIEKWDENLETLPDDLVRMLQDWMDDGTLDHIINETIFNWKVDQTEFDEFVENTTTQLAQADSRYDSTYINVKFLPHPYVSAVGDGVTDDTQAFKDAMEYAKTFKTSLSRHTGSGATVFIPAGDFLISEPLILEAENYVSFLGVGKPSVLIWGGGENEHLFYLGGVADEQKVYFEKFSINNSNRVTGFKAFKTNNEIGDLSYTSFVVNLTFRQLFLMFVDTGFEFSKETDQVVIHDCYFLEYVRHGVRCVQGINSNYSITNNHFRSGHTGSVAIEHVGGGNNLNIIGNTVQSGYTNAKAFYIKDLSNLRVEDTYFESTGVTDYTQDTNFLRLEKVRTAIIEGNTTTGNLGRNVISIDETSENINIGTNVHSDSGGYPQYFVYVDAPTTVTIYGVQVFPNVNTYLVNDKKNLLEYVGLSPFGGYQKTTSVRTVQDSRQMNLTTGETTVFFSDLKNGVYIATFLETFTGTTAVYIVSIINNRFEIKPISETDVTMLKASGSDSTISVTQSFGNVRSVQGTIIRLI